MRSLGTPTMNSAAMLPLQGEPPARPPMPSDSREWTISEMSRHFGLTLRALRFYESRGLIAPQRFGGARYYTARDRTRLQLVLTAKKMGFTLSETAEMLGKTHDAEPGALPLSSTTVRSQISFLEQQRSAIDQALATLRDRLDEMAG